MAVVTIRNISGNELSIVGVTPNLSPGETRDVEFPGGIPASTQVDLTAWNSSGDIMYVVGENSNIDDALEQDPISRAAGGVTVIADPGDTGLIDVAGSSDSICVLDPSGFETRSLAAPTEVGQRLSCIFNAGSGTATATITGIFGYSVVLSDAGGTALSGGAISLISDGSSWYIVGTTGTTGAALTALV